MSAFSVMAADLEADGLGSLFTYVDNKPGGWLWDQIQQGLVNDSVQLGAALEKTDAFMSRYGVIVEQKKRAAAGQPVSVMTPGEVRAYEKAVTQQMKGAGIPSWFYDEPGDFNQYILNNISPAQIQRKLEGTFEYVNTAAPEVRQAFSDYYGVGEGDQALAAYILDPDRTAARLEKAKFTAYVGGMSRRYNLNLDKLRAQAISELPMTEGGVIEGFTNISDKAGLFESTMFEDTKITAQGEGVGAEFFGDSAAQTAINRRQAARSALTGVSTGGAVTTNKGLVGARTAGGR